MSGVNKWAWAAIFAAITVAPVTAQTGGINSGGSTGGIGLGGGSGALTSSGLAGGLNSGSAGAGNGSGVGSSGLGSSQQGGNNGFVKPTGSASSSQSPNNFLSGYYANPMFQGVGPSVSYTPGGFGSALYNGTSTGTSARGGRTTTGTTTGAGRTGTTSNSQNQSGIVIPLPVQINYSAQMAFTAPRIAPTRVQTDIRAVIDNSSMITSGKSVQILTDVNNNVVLRGTVKDEDEARLIEGVVRLTPGVGNIQNELLFQIR